MSFCVVKMFYLIRQTSKLQVKLRPTSTVNGRKKPLMILLKVCILSLRCLQGTGCGSRAQLKPAITCSKLTTETLEHISHLFLVFLLLPLSMYMPAGTKHGFSSLYFASIEKQNKYISSNYIESILSSNKYLLIFRLSSF